jgi:hypothetical protein
LNRDLGAVQECLFATGPPAGHIKLVGIEARRLATDIVRFLPRADRARLIALL